MFFKKVQLEAVWKQHFKIPFHKLFISKIRLFLDVVKFFSSKNLYFCFYTASSWIVQYNISEDQNNSLKNGALRNFLQSLVKSFLKKTTHARPTSVAWWPLVYRTLQGIWGCICNLSYTVSEFANEWNTPLTVLVSFDWSTQDQRIVARLHISIVCISLNISITDCLCFDDARVVVE